MKHKPKAGAPDLRACRGCAYLGFAGGGPICEYILQTHHKRPCPIGAGCTVYEKEDGSMKRKTWDEDRAMALLGEGKTDAEIAGLVGATPGAIRGWRGRNRLRGNFEPRTEEGTSGGGTRAETLEKQTAAPSEGPLEISLTMAGCRLSLSAPGVEAAAKAASGLRRVLAGLAAWTGGDGA